jgi:hypothetical protein
MDDPSIKESPLRLTYTSSRRKLGTATLALLAAMALAACDGGTTEAGAPPRRVGAGDRNLQGVCPPNVVVQSNWYPTVDTATAWSLVGPGHKIDREKKRISGPLVAHGVDTGVDIEVRAGGPAIGFQQTSAQMYADPSITLGYVISDEAIAFATKQPTLSVIATLEIDPQVLIWDGSTYRGSPRSATSARATPRFSTTPAPSTWTTSSAPASCASRRSTAPTTAHRPRSWPTAAGP